MKIRITKEQAQKNFRKDMLECLLIAVAAAVTFAIALFNVGKMLNYDVVGILAFFTMIPASVVCLFILRSKLHNALWNRFPRLRGILDKID